MTTHGFTSEPHTGSGHETSRSILEDEFLIIDVEAFSIIAELLLIAQVNQELAKIHADSGKEARCHASLGTVSIHLGKGIVVMDCRVQEEPGKDFYHSEL